MADDSFSAGSLEPSAADLNPDLTRQSLASQLERDSFDSKHSSVPPTPSKSTSPPPPSVSDCSSVIPPGVTGQDSGSVDRLDTTSTITHDTPTLVEPSFDENILRSLCDLDCGVPLLLDRIRQSTISCREASQFFKKRAVVEEEYGRALQKLVQSTANGYSLTDGKAGTFVGAWQGAMRIHETMAENRIKFSHRLNEMGDELSALVKEVEKNRKHTKELAGRYERALQESELATEKSKSRLDVLSEELERVLVAKEGESLKESAVRSPGGASGKRALGKAVAKGGLLLKGKNPGNILRQEDDIRSRVSSASDAYRKAVTDTQAMRQEYFHFQLPRILRALKECADEIDLGTQYHLTRYAFLFENIVLSDGSTLVSSSGDDAPPVVGLKATFESIDNRADFRIYMQNYAFAHGNTPLRGPRREGPQDQGFLPPLPSHGEKPHGVSPGIPNGNSSSPVVPVKPRPTFGVDLAVQMARDGVEVPPIMEKCCQAIERYGIELQGIYRISGTMSKVTKLRERLDRDLDSVDLDADEWSADINNVTSVLKLWLRELPDPLLTFRLHQGFIDAAKIENDRLRHIRLHERVNDLPDPNYATLKYFLGHLQRINQRGSKNSMTVQNLAIVFGPTLFGQMTANAGPNGQMQGAATMVDAGYQNKAIETILEHYTDIFVDETDDS